MNESDNGSIWSVALDSPISEFVNSSVEQFACFIAAYTRLRTTPTTGRADALHAITVMEHHMRTIDPRALGADAAFWPAIILDVRLFAT